MIDVTKIKSGDTLRAIGRGIGWGYAKVGAKVTVKSVSDTGEVVVTNDAGVDRTLLQADFAHVEPMA